MPIRTTQGTSLVCGYVRLREGDLYPGTHVRRQGNPLPLLPYSERSIIGARVRSWRLSENAHLRVQV
jgi:hypothetical protein